MKPGKEAGQECTLFHSVAPGKAEWIREVLKTPRNYSDSTPLVIQLAVITTLIQLIMTFAELPRVAKVKFPPFPIPPQCLEELV